MGNARAIITNIQGYSIHDGPGIRTVVFMKGCPLRCKWCSNPENLIPEVQVGFIENLCTGCGRCADVCRDDAIKPGTDIYRIDRNKCSSCGRCAEACFYGALVRYGEEMSSAGVYDKVRRDKMFYNESGGGVTVSGGEPLIHPEFVRELFALCREEGIDTCIETCGDVPVRAFEEVIPLADRFLFDLKMMDGVKHREYTGSSNDIILSNAAFLVKREADVLFRMPLIPGVNDSEQNIVETAVFMKKLGEGGMNIQLMPYHRMGKSKYDALQEKYETEDIESMTPNAAEKAEGIFRTLGVNCTISR
jgi:pyruvate formate lyase activating enzyme